MKVGILLKSVAAAFLTRSGILRKTLKSLGRESVAILMYHRVLPAKYPKKGIQPGMYVTVNTFERQVNYLKEHFTIVSLEDVMKCERNGKTGARPLCCLTFDDGWQDFYEHVFPILKAHQIPATVFIPTDYIGGSRWFWTDRLGFILQFGSKTSVKRKIQDGHPLTQEILKYSGSSEACLEAAILRMKGCTEETIEQVLVELEACLGSKHMPAGRAFLDWEEVREMADSGLVSYGSHTASHRILTTLNDEEIRTELNKSKEKLLNEKVVSKEFIPFCYPNGSYNENIAKIISEVGYSLAVSIERGWNCETAKMFNLKRISVHEDITSTSAMLECRLAGIF